MINEPNLIRLFGILERVTFHTAENGWSVLKVSPFNEPQKLATVVIHQVKVFAGSSMEFWGVRSRHPKHGEQFKAERAIEKKPATSAALEKYLGSGLIRGVRPKTAIKIVKFFKEQTLQVFEERMGDLLEVPGIAEKKLLDIKSSWAEHKAIRDVMLFLQGYGFSTLFAVKIFKAYGPNAISVVSENPYQLAKDIYGMGFFSADKIALNMGFERDGGPRIQAGIKHVLAASREERKQNFKLYNFYAKCLLLCLVFLTGCGGGGYSGGGGMMSSSCPSSMTIPVAPAAPTNVSASSPAVGQVTVTWSPVTGAASYNLYMAAVSGVTQSNYSTLFGGMLHSNVCSPFIHPTPLTSGTTYYFVVTAVNIYGQSPDSAPEASVVVK